MMKKLLYCCVVILFTAAIPPVDGDEGIGFTFITELPSTLHESSGIEIGENNKFWSHNDSGGNDRLYAFDDEGDLIQRLTITNVDNQDWEDLAQDELGNFYIADIGNNHNIRDELFIYKIPNPTEIEDYESDYNIEVEAECITFIYEDQDEFPPDDDEKFYDAESLVAFSDSLYVFTKSQSDPFIGKTRMYRLANETGTTQEAEKLGTFHTDSDMLEGQITSADISPDHKKLILISYKKIWVFYNYEGRNFFDGDHIEVSIPEDFKKREAVCFLNDCELLITNEETSNSPQSMYIFNICEVVETQVELKVLLEGCYLPDEGLMHTYLNESNLLPDEHPYADAPYFHDGNEELDDIPENMVDWVLVEARKDIGGDLNTVSESHAGILLNDGRIVQTDGETPLAFQDLQYGESYHFVVRHRNHLDVCSREVVIMDNTYLGFDFTTGLDQALEDNQLFSTIDGKFALFAGDFNHDGVIQNTDSDLLYGNAAIIGEYRDTDANLDGVVQNTDMDAWLANKARIGASEIQF